VLMVGRAGRTRAAAAVTLSPAAQPGSTDPAHTR
jgi:hypothetical protein